MKYLPAIKEATDHLFATILEYIQKGLKERHNNALDVYESPFKKFFINEVSISYITTAGIVDYTGYCEPYNNLGIDDLLEVLKAVEYEEQEPSEADCWDGDESTLATLG